MLWPNASQDHFVDLGLGGLSDMARVLLRIPRMCGRSVHVKAMYTDVREPLNAQLTGLGSTVLACQVSLFGVAITLGVNI